MTTTRDEMWADLLQFDLRLADRVWDGDLLDPDAPGWYGEMGALIRQARGPGEPHELVDEPAVVTSMRRVRLGRAVADPPRRNRARMLGRIVAVKAAAVATTAGMAGVAAAATTGIVAATVVAPAIDDHIGPFIGPGFPTAVAVTEARVETERDPGATSRAASQIGSGGHGPAGPATGDEATVAAPVPDTGDVPLLPPATETDVEVTDLAEPPPTDAEQAGGEQADDTAPDTGDVPADPVPEPADEPVSPMMDPTGEPVNEVPADESAGPADPADRSSDDTAGPVAPPAPAVVDGTVAPPAPAVVDDTAAPPGSAVSDEAGWRAGGPAGDGTGPPASARPRWLRDCDWLPAAASPVATLRARLMSSR